MKLNSEVNTYIFDLGNVIVDLDAKKVLHGFSKHTKVPENQIKSLIVSDTSLFDYEVGAISTEQFIAEVNQKLASNISYQDFFEIWNSMLIDIPMDKLQLLSNLGESSTTIVMSNTNEMHEMRFNEMVSEISNGALMEDHVHHAYYSHKMGLRKPNPAVFEYIIDAHQIDPAQTVFFDDKEENLVSAESTGIHGVHIKQPDDLYTYFYDER